MAGGLVAAFVLVFALMFLDVGVGGIKGADPTVKGGEFREVGFDFVGGFAAVTVGDFRVGVHDGLVGLEQLEGIEGAAEDAGEGGAVIGDGFVIGVGVAKGFSVGFGVFGRVSAPGWHNRFRRRLRCWRGSGLRRRGLAVRRRNRRRNMPRRPIPLRLRRVRKSIFSSWNPLYVKVCTGCFIAKRP